MSRPCRPCRPRRPEHGPHGFSLIELIVALAVVAVLVAIAAPSYGSYVRRSLVSEALAATGPAKTAIAEEVTVAPGPGGSSPIRLQGVGTAVPGRPSAQAPAKAAPVALAPSPRIESVWRTGTTIVVNFDATFAQDGTTRYSLVLAGAVAADGTLRWQCRTGDAAWGALKAAADAGAPTFEPLPPNWAPSDCR